MKKELSEVQNSSWEGYSPDAEHINPVIAYLKNSKFKLSEVERVIKHHQFGQREKTGQDTETFIRSLTISYDEEKRKIKIREHGKKAKMHRSDRFKFTKKTWETFLSIIQESNTFCVGPAGESKSDTRKEYDRKQAIIKNINKILIKFFCEEFPLQIPESFRLYERDQAKGSGVYKFIFQTERDIATNNLFRSRYDKIPKNELLKYLKEWSDTYDAKPEDWLLQKINRVKQVLIVRDEMTDSEIKNLIFTKVFQRRYSMWTILNFIKYNQVIFSIYYMIEVRFNVKYYSLI